MINLTSIPAERLKMLDTATLYAGSHPQGDPDCQHCARELLHEVVTGVHEDAAPPGATAMISMLPTLNDGPWRDDEHRTQVLRPYLRHLLVLDPANDLARAYAAADYAVRVIAAEVLECAGLQNDASEIRNLPEIVDRITANAAARAASKAAAAYAAATIAAWACASAAGDAAAAAAAAARAAADAAAAARVAAWAAAYASAGEAAPAARAAARAAAATIERHAKALLDLVCAAGASRNICGLEP